MRPAIVAAFLVLVIAPPASAVETHPNSVSDAAYALQAAHRRLHYFRFVEYPQIVRTLDDRIQLAEAEVQLAASRVANYEPFRSFHQYAATYTAEQDWRLHLLAAQQRLEQLKSQRDQLNYLRRDTLRQLHYEINLIETALESR